MELEVLNTSGKKTSKKVKLNKDVFGIDPNDHAIYLDVKQHLANKRQGTHKAKERAEIKGSTRKIKRQKGTGTARAGSIKNPLFKGGGRVFGPRNDRNYGFKLNKKVKRLARVSALSHKAKDKAITVLEDFNMESPKTKEYISILNNLSMGDTKTLLVVSEGNKNVELSARNLQKANVAIAYKLNTYDILNAGNIIFTESALSKTEELLK